MSRRGRSLAQSVFTSKVRTEGEGGPFKDTFPPDPFEKETNFDQYDAQAHSENSKSTWIITGGFCAHFVGDVVHRKPLGNWKCCSHRNESPHFDFAGTRPCEAVLSENSARPESYRPDVSALSPVGTAIWKSSRVAPLIEHPPDVPKAEITESSQFLT